MYYLLIALVSISCASIPIFASESKQEARLSKQKTKKVSHPALRRTTMGTMLAKRLENVIIPKSCINDFEKIVEHTDDPASNLLGIYTFTLDFFNNATPCVQKAFRHILKEQRLSAIFVAPPDKIPETITALAILCRSTAPSLYAPTQPAQLDESEFI
jgi:hypothetical protein